MPLDAATAAFLKRFDDAAPDAMGIEAFRRSIAVIRHVGFPREEVASVRDLDVPWPGGTVGVRVYRPDAGEALPMLVCAHGGGWVRVTVELMDGYYRALANRSGCVVAAVDYSLAPEAPFPTALEEVHGAARWVQQHAAELGGDPARLAVYGESAGGNLAAASTLLARERGDVDYAFQVLIAAALDLHLDTPSWHSMDGRYGVRRAYVDWQASQYVQDADRSDPRLSPLLADVHANLPPALVVVGELDPLRDEGLQYAAALAGANVPVTTWDVPGLIHHAVLIPQALPLGAVAMDGIAARVASALATARA